MKVMKQANIPGFLSTFGKHKCPVCGLIYRLEVFSVLATYYSHNDDDVCVYVKSEAKGDV